MIRIKVSTSFPDWPLIRQTPGRSGLWGDCQFLINQEVEECDWWVVYDDLPGDTEHTICPAQNTILITGEPPSVKTYHRRFLAQFNMVITCQQVRHPNVIHVQQALPWMVGCRYIAEEKRWDTECSKDYDDFSTMPLVEKTKLISVISSDKQFTPGHARRYEFVKRLKEHFGDDLDVFGRGIRDVEDKWDAIAPYQYHIAVENSAYPNYWTEKLSDTLLAEAYPIYAGCPNINRYFSNDILTSFDLSDFQQAIKTIQNIIDKNIADHQWPKQAAKERILNEYNLFAYLAFLVSHPAGQIRTGKTIIPIQQATPIPLRRKVKNLLKSFLRR